MAVSDLEQTRRSFREKWANNPDAAFVATITEGSSIQDWILTRNGFATLKDLERHLSTKTRLLDAGCGNGRVTALLASVFDGPIVGIDLNAAPVAASNLAELRNVTVAEKDLLGELSDLGSFDFIYCQEVLHHTDDARRAFLNVARRLTPGGEIAIYVYRKKPPIREYADDYIRDRIKDLDYETSMEAARQITELGRRLSALDIEVDVPDVDVLEIKAGRYPVQRFLYHFFLKCFWNPELSERENAIINYDWYHPATATRHTMDEVRGWFDEAGLARIHELEDPYGITMRGLAPGKP